MTFANLRALHGIIGDALDEIERVYAEASVAANTAGSPSPTPSSSPATPSSPAFDVTTRSTGRVLEFPFSSPANSKLSEYGACGLGESYVSPPPSPSVSTFACSQSTPPLYPSTPPQIQTQPRLKLLPSANVNIDRDSSTTLPSPLTPTTPFTPYSGSSETIVLDFPSLDVPTYDSPPAAASTSEGLTTHPTVIAAINRIVAAAGQMSATVQVPFLSLCDASMGYHLPSCLRILESAHIVEILREAGPSGLHVATIAERCDIHVGKLAHILRLLATHHILLELSPDVFANNRISALVDSGKTFEEILKNEDKKYDDTNGIAAFVGLCTDELFKSSAYLTEAYRLDPSTKYSREPTQAPFNFAFRTKKGFFGWLEQESDDGHNEHILKERLGQGPRSLGAAFVQNERELGKSTTASKGNMYRLERFGKAMMGTASWEVPGAVLNGFDWSSLPPGSIIVDVGGGIGSTSMSLANEFIDKGLKFIIQDRPVVVEMGEKAWRARCPNLLDSGTAKFQVHDFFTPQPIRDASIFLLRVILHDWPEDRARRILLQLRDAAREPNGDDKGTRLIIADFMLPLACVDDFGSKKCDADGHIEGVEGAEQTLAPAPLLANLGKASANAYWMDLTMQVTFNGQERTLREIVALTLSAGWKVVKVTRATGSLFAHIVAEPVAIPIQRRARAGSGSAFFDANSSANIGRMGSANAMAMGAGEQEMVEAASSRCGTPTFGSRMELPSMAQALSRFGGGVIRGKGRAVGRGRAGPPVPERPGTLKPAVTLISTTKKKPSPLSFRPAPILSPRSSRQSSPVPSSPILRRRASQASLPTSYHPVASGSPVLPRQPPSSPMSPRHPPPSSMARRLSHAPMPQAGLRKRSGSVMGFGGGIGGGISMGSLLRGGRDSPAAEPLTGSVSVLEAAARIERGSPIPTPHSHS